MVSFEDRGAERLTTKQSSLFEEEREDTPCLAPCIPICCTDCPLGKWGETFGMIGDD